MQHPPLARYRDNLIGFVRDFTPIKAEPLERRVFGEFQEGHRHALGFSAWSAPSMLRTLFLSNAIVAWKTLCFPDQLTGVYAKNMRKAQPWLNSMRLFVGNCDPLVHRLLQFHPHDLRVGLNGDEFWRIVVFNPNESELEAAQRWLTNVVYYDFDRVPEWLIAATQQSVKRPGIDRPVSLSLFCYDLSKLPSRRPT